MVVKATNLIPLRGLQGCLVVSMLWFSHPFEIPVALLAPIVAFVIYIRVHRKTSPTDYWPYLFSSILLGLFLLSHWALNNISTSEFGWQILRVCYPLLGGFFIEGIYRQVNLSMRKEASEKILNTGTAILAIEALMRVMFSPYLAGMAILGDHDALYEFKSGSFLYTDANSCAFFATIFLSVSLINSKKHEGVWRNIFTQRQIALFLIIYLSFSRQAWYGSIATIGIVVSKYLIPNRLSKIYNSRILLVLLILVISIFAIANAENYIDSLDRESLSAGSGASKLDIALYTAAFVQNASTLSYFIGLGPQQVIAENIISYTGHSLVGIFPEFGVFIFLLFIPYIKNRNGILVLAPTLAGAAISFFPYAYALPAFIALAGIQDFGDFSKIKANREALTEE